MQHNKKQKRSEDHLPESPSSRPSNTTQHSAENAEAKLPGYLPLPHTTAADAPKVKQPKQQQTAHTAAPDSTQPPTKTKALPVLPWMRVPISIEGGTGIPLSQITGLHPLALAALQASKLSHPP